MRPRLFAILCGMVVAACDSAPPPGPVVVYLSDELEFRFVETLAKFTAETDIPVEVVVAPSDAGTDKVIDNRGTPPADVLMTSSVADIWRAAEKGALRPLQGTVLQAVPATLRDPDGLWAAADVHQALIAAAADADISRVRDYGDLARSEFRGAVCLSSAALSVNRSLVGMLIEDLGVKPAERMVRAWVRNLAAAPFATETELLDALRSGDCDYGIVSSSINTGDLSLITPHPSYVDIDGIGVARHAVHPDAAQTLVNWMLTRRALQEPVASNGKNVGLAGWRDEDVTLLAERAGYR